MCKETTINSSIPSDCSELINNVATVPDGINLYGIPLYALQPTSRNKLSNYLDPRKYLQTSNGLFRDWRGISHLSNLSIECESSLVSNQTCEILHLLEEQQPDLTMGAFVKMLCDIDRWDIVADVTPFFEEDAIEFRRSQQVTTHDAESAEQNSPFEKYDAFLLFVDEDVEFALTIIKEMQSIEDQVEDSKHLKLCSKLDFLPGITFENDAVRDFLIRRCDRLIVILSPEFVHSELNPFLSDLSQSLGLDKDLRRIIPCLYKWCELSAIFHPIHTLSYERSIKFRNSNFWERLRYSMEAPCPVDGNTISDVDFQEQSSKLTSLLAAQEMEKRNRSFLKRGFKLTRKFVRRILS